MNYRSAILVFLVFISMNTFSQNLIPNGGFEQPVRNDVEHWRQPGGDYNHYDHRPKGAHSGEYYNGICMYNYMPHPNEYMSVRLADTLVKDSLYHLEFYFRVDGDKDFNVDQMKELGLDFRTEFHDVYERQIITTEPDVIVPLHEYNNKYYWSKFETIYQAQGGERYMLVGNFEHDLVYDQNLRTVDSIVMANSGKLIKDDTYNGIQYLNDKQARKVDKFLNKIAEDVFALYDSLEWRSRTFGYSLLYRFDDFCLAPIDPDGGWQCETGGLSVGESVILSNIFFETGSDELLDESTPALDSLYDLLLDHPTLRIEIGGHTDNGGDADENKDLSAARAYAVVEHLIYRGIAPARLSFVGYGESQPVASNATEEGREQNRRVEFKVVEK